MTRPPVCVWCNTPVDLDGPEKPTTVTIPTWGQTVILHGPCGAQLFTAGLNQRPADTGPVVLHQPERLTPDGGRPRRLTLVRGA